MNPVHRHDLKANMPQKTARLTFRCCNDPAAITTQCNIDIYFTTQPDPTKTKAVIKLLELFIFF